MNNCVSNYSNGDCQYAVFDPTNLKFRNVKDDWRIFSLNLGYGTVGCFASKDVPCWDMFIVVEFDSSKKIVGAILPRIRIINGSPELGEDKLQEKFKSSNSFCACSEQNRTNGLCCRNAYDKMVREYVETYSKKPANYYYKIIHFEIPSNDIYLFPVAKHWVNQFDIPLVDKRFAK